MTVTKRQFRNRLCQMRDDAKRAHVTTGAAGVYTGLLELLDGVDEWNTTPPEPRPANPLISITEGARRLGCDRSWIYRHADQLPFLVDFGEGTRRKVCPVKLEEYIIRNRGPHNGTT